MCLARVNCGEVEGRREEGGGKREEGGGRREEGGGRREEGGGRREEGGGRREEGGGRREERGGKRERGGSFVWGQYFCVHKHAGFPSHGSRSHIYLVLSYVETHVLLMAIDQCPLHISLILSYVAYVEVLHCKLSHKTIPFACYGILHLKSEQMVTES